MVNPRNPNEAVIRRHLRFRRFNRLRALFLGYFWLPCPACGRMFGGHESGWRVIDGRVACKAHDPWRRKEHESAQ